MPRLGKQDYASGRALMRATFGDYPKARLLKDQREAIAEDVAGERNNFPREMRAIVGTYRDSDFRGDKPSLIRGRMTFAGTAIFTKGELSDVDLTQELIALYLAVKAASPYQTGAYRAAVSFWNNDTKSRSRSVPRDATYVGVTVDIEYGGRLEMPDSPHRPFWNTFRAFRTRARGRYDLRIRYLPYEDNASNYPMPVIEIAPLNAMGGSTGVQFTRRRGWRRQRLKAYQNRSR